MLCAEIPFSACNIESWEWACSWNETIRICIVLINAQLVTMNFKSTTATYIMYTDCTDGDIRLVGGSSELEGRVEVCVDGVWGTVCSDLWGTEESSVACRQLGFSQTGKPNHITCYQRMGLIAFAICASLAKM